MTISDPSTASWQVTGYFSPEGWAEAAQDDVSLDEVRRALSTVSGSLTDAGQPSGKNADCQTRDIRGQEKKM